MKTRTSALRRFTRVPLHAARILAGSIAALLTVQAAQSATLYWDLNESTANTAAPLTGTWDGMNVIWNNASTGTGGIPQAGTTNGDDLIFSSGSIYTSGTVTLSGAQVAGSITFEDNVAVTRGEPVDIHATHRHTARHSEEGTTLRRIPGKMRNDSPTGR